MPWNETQWVHWLQRRLGRERAPRAPLLGSLHDAAVLGPWSGRFGPALCIDATIECVHFLPSARARAVGWKACARSLSDLAATGARPRAVVLSLIVPSSASSRWMRAATEGVAECAKLHGARLVGGDTSSSPRSGRGARTLVVCALGDFPSHSRPIGRSHGRPGDVLVLTGSTGGSLLGRHLAIQPRIRAGRALAQAGARAMLDISDGLALDLSRLAQASALRLDVLRVPVHPDAVRQSRTSGRSPKWHALHDGEDHELAALLPPRALARARRLCPNLLLIGRARRGSGLWIASSAQAQGHRSLADLDRDPGAGRLERWRAGSGGFVHGTS